ncbi:Elongation factor 1-delta 2 [Raphanus sativus]|nr:Elongation factor 1-delta 2 [Raphanus sativus]
MAASFPNFNSDSGLKKLDEHLLTRSYITGYQASKDDITVFTALAKPPTSQYVNASRWYSHIDALLRISGVSAEGSSVIVEGSAPVAEEAVATPPAADSKDRSHRMNKEIQIMLTKLRNEMEAAGYKSICE